MIIGEISLFNLARGQGTGNADGNDGIVHWQFLTIAAVLIASTPMPLKDMALWYGVIAFLTILPTHWLLDAGHGDLNGVWKGALRSLPAMPLFWLLHLPAGFIFTLEGALYYACGKWKDPRSTRLAEGLAGLTIDILIFYWLASGKMTGQ